MAYLRDRRAFGNIGTRKFRGARFGDPLSPRGPQYTKEGLILDYSTDVGPFTIIDQSGQDNTATLYSGRGLTMDAVGDTVTYATGYSSASRTATLWGRFNTTSPVALLGSVSGSFIFTPTATGVWEELTSTATVEGDLAWDLGLDFDIGDLRVGTEHWTHNDWSDPIGNTSNGKTIVDSGPNQLHGVCTGCSGFTGEGIDPEVAGIVGYDDAQWFNGVNTRIDAVSNITVSGDFTVSGGFLSMNDLTASADILEAVGQTHTLRANITTGVMRCGISGSNYDFSTIVLPANDGVYREFTLSRIGSDLTLSVTGIGEETLTATTAPFLVRSIGGRSTGGLNWNGLIANLNINGVAAYTGRGATPWTDTIGSNDGTPSGTFVTVGQKRATIPQTADRNWNKYQWFNGVDTSITAATPVFPATADFDETFEIYVGNLTAPASYLYYISQASANNFGLAIAPTTGVITVLVAGVAIQSATSHYGEHITVRLTRVGTTFEMLINGVSEGTYVSALSIDQVATVFGKNATVAGRETTGLLYGDSVTGTESGTFTRELVSASDANDQIDALGNAILEPRRNTQQLNLFGEGEYSRTPDSDSLDVTTTATWEIWGNFYGDTPLTSQAILSKTRFTGDERTVDITKSVGSANNTVNFTSSQNGRGATIFSRTLTVTDKISHIVFTYDGATQTMVGYIDGVLTAFSATSGTVPTSIFVNTQPYMIGARPSVDPASNFAPFKVGSAKIYNRALTADEVLTNYESQKSLYLNVFPFTLT